MGDVLIFLQAALVIALIAVGVHFKGMAIGLFGGLGVLIFALAFSVAPGPVPVSAMLIILAVVTAAGTMQLAGGVDYLVSIAEKVIRRFPTQITYIAPITTFLFCAGAGTGNIYYSLMPVIYEVSYAAGIRPERPLSLSATAGQLAITSSPVSAAMAAMVGLLAPLGFRLTDILVIVFPASLLALLAGGFVMNRLGKNLADDPEYQRRLAAGEIEVPVRADGVKEISRTAKLAAVLFMAGLAVIILAGLIDHLHPNVMVKGKSVPLDMSLFIEMAMLATSALIVALCGVKAAGIPKSPLFSSGLVAVVALFGVAWMANTFIAANEAVIVGGLGELARKAPLLISVALFAVAALTTSQSSTTFSIIPIGIALGIPPQYLAAMWPSIVGVFLLPTNGAQIATVEIDRTGTTRIGQFVINHSFIVPVLVFTVVSVGAGFLIASTR
jgi:anaerobic C4-dicarboxylate transporter DcuA/anaerobic C4-dicarboxylate transporter DcuB